MAFGVKRHELRAWKEAVQSGQIAFLTHFWIDPRFPHAKTVTKVGCNDVQKLIQWGKQYDLNPKWIHHDPHFPHFDLMGNTQVNILKAEDKQDHIERFRLKET